MFSGVSALVAEPSKALDRKVFFGSLITVTALPLLFLPWHDMHVATPANGLLLMVWIVAGYSHVMSTLWFGVDEDYRPVIAANRMRMLGSLPVPADKTVTLAPGAIHVMVTGVQAPLVAGSSVDLTLRFAKAGERKVTVAIVAPGAR